MEAVSGSRLAVSKERTHWGSSIQGTTTQQLSSYNRAASSSGSLPSANREPLTASSSCGFTLVELVVALTISAVLVGFIAAFISAPVDAYVDQSERALLSDATQVISRSLAADLRDALPNSVRIRNVGTRSIVEMLKVEAVSFYLPAGALATPPAPHPRELDFGVAADTFSVFGRVTTNPTTYLVVGHQGAGIANADAYRLQDVIAANFDLMPLGDGEDQVQLPAGVSFETPDTLNRIFWVSGPITYICNSAANARTLRRFSNYSISQNIPTSETSAQLTGGGAVNVALATSISSCNLRCVGGGANVDVCQDTLVIELSVQRAIPSSNETIRILEQIPLDNRL